MASPIKDEWCSDDGSVRLILGDCLEILPTLSGIDDVVTDPPYGIGAAKGSHSNLKMPDEDWDETPADVSMILSLSVPTIIWGGNYFHLPPCRGFLIWDKHPMPPSYAFGEFAWTNLQINAAKWCGKVGDTVPVKVRLHPTQKPVALMEWCLGFIPEARTVCDFYMGSGTTGVACIYAGRRFIGIDKSRKYWDIAVERCKREIKLDKSSFQIRPKPRPAPAGFFEKSK